MRKRKAETLMEFLIAMAVSGMLFIMISTALQRSTSSVANIYNQDILRAAAKKYIAGLPDELTSLTEEHLYSYMNKRVSQDIITFSIDVKILPSTPETVEAKLFSIDLYVNTSPDKTGEPYKLSNIIHFFSKK